MAPPNIIDGMTRNGSAAANGIAPSEMKQAPRSQAALPFSRSGSVNRPGADDVASAIASGGTMPAAITAAMIRSDAGVGGGEPGGGERVGRLVDRPAEVEAHHQAEDDAEQDRGGAGHAAEPVGQARW